MIGTGPLLPLLLRRSLANLRDAREGGVTVLLGAALLMLLGVASVCVDLGSVYLAQRRLQGIADAAAMAAAQETAPGQRESMARAIITRSNAQQVSIDSLENGHYRKDKSIEIEARFAPGGDNSAARLRLSQTVPLFFARALGMNDATVRAEATAAKLDMAAYSLGSSLLKVSDGIPNALLSALTGTQLELSVLDTQGLASTQIDLLGFADAVKAQVNAKDIAYAELFDRPIDLGTALRALAASTKDTAVAATIAGIADSAPYETILLSDILDLGPYGALDYNPGTASPEIDAYSLIRTMLEAGHGDELDVQFNLAVTGLSSLNVRLVRGTGLEHSPWLTVTGASNYSLRTAQARLLLTARVGTGSALLPSLELPIYIDLAEAEATLNDISCTGNPATDGVTLGVSPALGTVGIGKPDASDMGDLSEEVTLTPATLVSVPLLAKVTGLSQVSLGGKTAPQEVLFTLAEIRDDKTKTVATNDLARSLATSLISQTKLNVQALGLMINLSTITSIVGNTLSLVAPILDTTIFSLTEALGVKPGAADVHVDKVRCGVSTVIA
ncbi:hypothetical protein I5E68_07880 [Novosphingobium sp. YJ-S2-02]|uniref:DUF2134 domain-containing protein n=1 Tax=Novosphingobium aureum TaxID=2792964 RepID=A0A931MKW1_9SPHN|nr:TadG family pilus assembly protein [Novosphingobium aureum]MBH0112869.1 hypothetical protein [Novosphingobium aureum]